MKLELKVEEIQEDYQRKMKQTVNLKQFQASKEKIAEEEKSNGRLKDKVKQM